MREARDTRYHRLVVADAEGSRYLRFDSSFQSGMYIAAPFRTRFAYTDYLELGLAYNPGAKKILVIGLGGASAPKRVWHDFGDVQLTVVELDPAVVETAYTWFALPHDRRIDVQVDDGRRYLQRHDERYDVIMLDAFYSDGVPFHLTTLEFVELLRDRLTPGGVIATNVIGALTGSSSRITRAFWKTYAAVFPTVVLHPVYEGPYDRVPDEIRNIILVATERAAPRRAQLAATWADVRAHAPPGAPTLGAAIAEPMAAHGAVRRRAAAHGRLRADRRVAARLAAGTVRESKKIRAASYWSRRHAAGRDHGIRERDVGDRRRRAARPSCRSVPSTRDVRRVDPEAGREHAVARARHPAALDVTEHGHPRLEPRQLLQVRGDQVGHPAEPLEAERVELRRRRVRRAAA